jgi:hypothetical protein
MNRTMKPNMKAWIFVLSAAATLMVTVTLQAAGSRTPLFDDLGSHSRKITTDSDEAQRYFDQGLRFLFGFNHGMAIRSFQEAARLDPECAMAHWGVALACGPHINFPLVPPPRVKMAWSALTRARQYAADATPIERDLIESLGHRYANPQPEDRTPLDRAYAEAMRKLRQRYPDDVDVAVFSAEAPIPWETVHQN